MNQPTTQSNHLKKILYIVTQGEMGGAQKYVFDLATRITASVYGSAHYEAVVAMGSENPELGERIKSSNAAVKVVYLKNLVRNINPIKDIYASVEIYRLIKEYRPDIVHLNSSKAGFLGSIAGRIAGNGKIVFTAHGFAFLEPRSWLVKKLYFLAEYVATWFRDRVICVSKYDHEAALSGRLGKADKFVTVHNGIDINHDEFLPKEEARKQICERLNLEYSSSAVWIGTIANLYKTKGISILIEAARYARKRYPDIRFFVIGDGDERGVLDARISRYDLSDNFFLTGQIKDAKNLLHAFDVFALPSLKEGFPYTLLEASVAGLPIVATNVGGVSELLTNEENALLVEPNNPGALTSAIFHLIQEKERSRALGQKARERAGEFTLQKMVEETVSVYENL